VIEAAYHAAGLSPRAVLWDEPLALVGWLVAQNLRRQGVKGIGRKVDYAKLKAAMAAATGEAR